MKGATMKIKRILVKGQWTEVISVTKPVPTQVILNASPEQIKAMGWPDNIKDVAAKALGDSADK